MADLRFVAASGGHLDPIVLQVIWWRFNSWGYLSAWIANLVMSWLVVWVLPAYGVIPKLPEYQQFWLLAALVAVVYLPMTLLTKPDDMTHLVQYYVMARPLGWWGPVRREAIRRGLITAPEVAGRGVRNGAMAQRLEPGPGR